MDSPVDGLNPAQAAAVSAPSTHCLVVAGAGSGKTRVLTRRIAHLIHQGTPGHAILAVTFTNKAAGEMKERLEALLGPRAHGLWVGTFHGIAHRLLRRHAPDIGLVPDFQVLDSDDQRRLVKQVVQSMELDDKMYPPARGVEWISRHKDDGHRPRDIQPKGPDDAIWLDVYVEYQARCDRAGLVDFGELLLRTSELFARQPALLSHYRQRFRHILVDEFQDTNAVQYDIVKTLAEGGAWLFAVGDQDQSIYGWRGARVENIDQFQRDFSPVHLLRLEQNYRSTATILSAANHLISNNPARIEKNLWTDAKEGPAILHYVASSERDEGAFVASIAQQWIDRGNEPNSIAVLYRSNAQSRAIEEQMIARRLPYRIHGGVRFFERAEVKDAMAYLRLAAHPDDDPSFERIINLPARGLGPKVQSTIASTAISRGCSKWQALSLLLQEEAFAPKTTTALEDFVRFVDGLGQASRKWPLMEIVRMAVEDSGLRAHHARAPQQQGESRVENLDELLSVATRFQPQQEDLDTGLSELGAFLAQAALEAAETAQGPAGNTVNLMTLHAAKGLEFPLVFLVGVEEGLFPTARACESEDGLFEERRLAYVGITRAMRQLVISNARQRLWYGRTIEADPSRFIEEIPSSLIKKKEAPRAPSHQGRNPAWRSHQGRSHRSSTETW